MSIKNNLKQLNNALLEIDKALETNKDLILSLSCFDREFIYQADSSISDALFNLQDTRKKIEKTIEILTFTGEYKNV